MKKIAFTAAMLCSSLLLAAPAQAADKAGEIVSLRGKSAIIRADRRIEAAVKDSLFMQDTVTTEKASRAKILFNDDSLLTLAELSQVSVKDYIAGDDKKRGQSVFRLIDGKVRSIVGKNTFEIHTPTAVAAARGTAFITWTGKISKEQMDKIKGDAVIDAVEVAEALKGRTMADEGTPASCVSMLHGTVNLRNIDPAVQGSEAVSAGNLCCVIQGMPPTRTAQNPKDLMLELMLLTGIDDHHGIGTEGAFLAPTEPVLEFPDLPVLPPIYQDPIIPGAFVEPAGPPEEQQP